MKKIVFNDLTEIEIQDVSFNGLELIIKSLGSKEKMKEMFNDRLKTRKMTVTEDEEELQVFQGYTELYGMIEALGGINGVILYKPQETPEATAMIQSDVIKLAKIQAKALSDDEAILVPNLYDQYEEKDYKRDDRVLDNGVLYKALHDIKPTDMQGKTPSEMPTLWSKVLGESGIEPWGQPGSTNGYKKGAKVIHNGKTWESTQDNNVWEPGTVGAPWKEVTE